MHLACLAIVMMPRHRATEAAGGIKVEVAPTPEIAWTGLCGVGYRAFGSSTQRAQRARAATALVRRGGTVLPRSRGSVRLVVNRDRLARGHSHPKVGQPVHSSRLVGKWLG